MSAPDLERSLVRRLGLYLDEDSDNLIGVHLENRMGFLKVNYLAVR